MKTNTFHQKRIAKQNTVIERNGMNYAVIIDYLQKRIDSLRFDVSSGDDSWFYLGEDADNEVTKNTIADVLDYEISLLKELKEQERIKNDCCGGKCCG